MIYGIEWKRFFRDLRHEIEEDGIFDGAAALAYFLVMAIFPASIFLLTLLPYLPIQNLQQALIDFIKQALPGDAASLFIGVLLQITTVERGGLLSFGLLFTLWSASSGFASVINQLNVTYDVKDSRPWWRVRGVSLLLTLMLSLLIIGAFAFIVFGGMAEAWLGDAFGLGWAIRAAFAAVRWAIIAGMLLAGFALTYYFGPDVEQKFRFITPGSVIGASALVLASLAFRVYVVNFGKYNATYGSLGAGIVLLLFLYIFGLVLLLGSEVNALVEHYSPDGKNKGEKLEPAGAEVKARPIASTPTHA